MAASDGAFSTTTRQASSFGTLASLSLAMLLSSLGTSVANVALPTLALAFAASFQAVQWVVLAYLVAVTAPIVGVGRLGDVVGRRRLLLSGIVLFTAASAASGMASSLGMLTYARALQGLGAAIMMALAVAFVGAAVPETRTGAAMGLLGTMSAVGTALGPSLGGLLLAGLGWRAIFFVKLPLGGLTLLLAHRYLPDDRPAPHVARPRFDITGMVLLAVTLAAYALAVTTGRGHFGGLNAALLVVAVAGGALFVVVEGRATSPLVRLSMLRDPVLSASLASSVLVSTVMMATLVVGPFYLSRGLGLGVAAVGLSMSAGPLVSALTGLPAGLAVDWLGAQRMTRVGLAGMLAGSAALAVMPPSSGAAGYVALVVILTAGYAVFQAANNTVIMSRGGPEQRGVLGGMLGLSRNLGLITGASVMGALFAFAAAASDVASARPEAVASGMRVTFGAAAALIAGALAIALGAHARGTPSAHEVSDESHVRRGKPPLRRDASGPHDGGSGQRVATERMKRGALDVAARIGGELEENRAIPAALALQVIGARSGGRAPEGLDEPGREALLEYTNSTSSASSCD